MSTPKVLAVIVFIVAVGTSSVPMALAEDYGAPKIRINYPREGLKVDSEQIVIRGLVTDDVGVERVLVTVNGRMVVESAVGARRYWVQTPVTLQPGDNIMEITALNKAGNAAKIVRTVTRVRVRP